MFVEKMNLKTIACLSSLDGGTDTVLIVGKVGDNQFIAEYKGVHYTAIFNPFVGRYYVDTKYGKVQ